MRQVFYIICLFFLIFGCDSPNDGLNPDSEVITVANPVNLVFPHEGSLCNEGFNITPTESTVFFQWEPSETADSYILIIENLSTGEIITTETAQIKISITILRSAPYSWYVIAVSNNTSVENKKSETWQFYNAGAGESFYAPFPATINAPSMAATIPYTSNITLMWTGKDVDNDIVFYDVYFGINSTPVLYESVVLASELSVPVTSSTIYYWRVITKDKQGNSSDSGVYQFKVQ
jgi:hypothetical protein